MYKQHDITDCGAACLATICKQNGYNIGTTKIREVAGTDKQGTNVAGVIMIDTFMAIAEAVIIYIRYEKLKCIMQKE